MNKCINTPWIENKQYSTEEQASVIILHNFELITPDSDITIKTFGSAGNEHLVIDPERKEEKLNRIVTHIDKDNSISEKRVIDLFKRIKDDVIYFVESEGMYYQMASF